MRALSSSLRKQLESSVLAARRASESASRAAIEGLGVFAERRPDHLSDEQAALRNGLRAKWRQLGGGDDAKSLLVMECAYEQWHRLLFARFLAENRLLLHPQYRASVTLADCEELATALGEPDGWSVAARFAAEILPGIFRPDDPCVQLRLAPEGRHALELILDGLPTEVFIADDALGWVYQFWQKDKKDEVNNSERKVGGADLGPVTQLFTENYMVRFLLENSLGAWWATRHLDSPLVSSFDYLRFDDDGNPAAGSFDAWPEHVAEVTVMDPCCGSGHFLVEAFSMLWQMRAEEEGIAPLDAQDAVLRDNLFGLELDARCVQIAMFAMALQAWKTGDGWRQLPVPNIACSGVPVKARVDEWTALAGGDTRLENALVRLHVLFRDADTLGSLIDPQRTSEITDPTGLQTSIEDVEWDQVGPLLEHAATGESGDPAAEVLGAATAGLTQAARLLSRTYTLVATNPPFLSAGKQIPLLQDFLGTFWPEASADLATAFLLRCRSLAGAHGTVATVSPYVWLTLNKFEGLRKVVLETTTFNVLAGLGANAFRTDLWDFSVILLALSGSASSRSATYMSLDVADAQTVAETETRLHTDPLSQVNQSTQQGNPRSIILFSSVDFSSTLGNHVAATKGLSIGDRGRFVRRFWEAANLEELDWRVLRTTPSGETAWSGQSLAIRWTGQGGDYLDFVRERLGDMGVGAWIRGEKAWGRAGVVVGLVGRLPVSLYAGEFFDANVVAIVPSSSNDLSAILAFLKSPDFLQGLRSFNKKLAVESEYLLRVPFNLERWRKVAEAAGPLPEPWSDDPTQWLFEGRPDVSTAPLQVAVARLLGNRWPEQSESDDLDELVDADGIVCLPSVAGEAPAADRVTQLLARAFGEAWSPARVRELLEQAGSKKNNLADWLRDEFFKQHCTLFNSRPFVWHIWDGQRDGFAALVNYHRLDRKTLEKLTYSYLGQDWVERQRAAVRDEVAGAEARLAAALELQHKLEAILEGEKPFDIFVRWKELREQPIGWEPDLNDGVRLNIRPFVEAGVLRSPFNIHWKKDRGKNPDGSERHNDIHHSLAERRDARVKAGRP